MLKQTNPTDVTFRLVGAGLFVALGTVAAFVMLMFGIDAEFQAFVPSIVLACLAFGFTAGAIASAVSSLLLWYYFVPPPGFALPTFGETTHLLAFLAVALFLCRVLTRQQRTNDELAQENFELGYKNFLLREIRSRLGSSRG